MDSGGAAARSMLPPDHMVSIRWLQSSPDFVLRGAPGSGKSLAALAFVTQLQRGLTRIICVEDPELLYVDGMYDRLRGYLSGGGAQPAGWTPSLTDRYRRDLLPATPIERSLGITPSLDRSRSTPDLLRLFRGLGRQCRIGTATLAWLTGRQGSAEPTQLVVVAARAVLRRLLRTIGRLLSVCGSELVYRAPPGQLVTAQPNVTRGPTLRRAVASLSVFRRPVTV